MKIRNLFLAVMTLALTVTGCSKVDTPAADNDLKFVFEMADKDGFGADTKAVKTGWADGDQVVILFKPEGQGQCLISQNVGSQKKYPKRVLGTFDGIYDEWNFVLENNLEVGNLGAGGTYYAIHHRGNVDLDYKTEVEIGIDCFPLNFYEGGELLSYVGNYTVTGNVVNFGVIRMTLDPRLFQVSIPEELGKQEGGTVDLDAFVYNSEPVADKDIEDYMRTESVQLTIYNGNPHISAGDGGVSGYTAMGYVALKPGAVSVDLKDSKVFVYNTTDYKTNAKPVINKNGEKREYSFCFAEPDLANPIGEPREYYLFRVTRMGSGSYDVPSGFKDMYNAIEYYEDTRNLQAGNAYVINNKKWYNL